MQLNQTAVVATVASETAVQTNGAQGSNRHPTNSAQHSSHTTPSPANTLRFINERISATLCSKRIMSTTLAACAQTVRHSNTRMQLIVTVGASAPTVWRLQAYRQVQTTTKTVHTQVTCTVPCSTAPTKFSQQTDNQCTDLCIPTELSLEEATSIEHLNVVF